MIYEIILEQITNPFFSDLLTSIAGAIVGSWITVHFAIKSYQKQVEDNKKIDYYKKDKLEKEKLNFFSASLFEIIRVTKSQIGFIDDYIGKLSSDLLHEDNFLLSSSNVIDLLASSVNIEEYYLAYVSQKSEDSNAAKLFNDIVSLIYFLSNSFSDLRINLKKRRDALEKSEAELAHRTLALHSRIFILTIYWKRDDSKLEELSKIIKSYSSEKITTSSRYIKFLVPISTLVRSTTLEDRDLQEYHVELTAAIKCYLAAKNANENLLEDLKSFREEMDKGYRYLVQLSSSFKEF